MPTDPASVGKNLGDRFHIVNALPATTLTLFVGATVASGAYTGPASLGAVGDALRSAGLQESALLGFLVILASLSINSFQTSLVKVLEGYWKPSGIRGLLLEHGLARHDQQRQQLGVDQTDQWEPTWWQRLWLNRLPAPRREEHETRYKTWASDQLGLYPPDEERELAEEGTVPDRIMPTRLGNALRRMEDLAGDRFGLDAIQAVPHLLALADADTVSVMGDARTELDVTTKFVYVWSACCLVGLAAFIDDGPWLAVPVLSLGLAWLSYEASVAAALAFGEVLVQLVNLYRFDLVRKLHWPLPADMRSEVEQNRVIWNQLAGTATDAERGMPYHHHEP